MKILVADDSKTNLAMLSASLTSLGHTPIQAVSGYEAIVKFKEEQPDLIILDVIMEGMDGFECAKQIRAMECEDWIPIIFLSGAVDDENVAKGINAGGDDYLAKPFSEITLAAKIKAMQRISDMRKQLYDATKKLSHLSSVDALTNIYNRFQFDKTIREKVAAAERHHHLLALLFLDLDNFKNVNDNLGHHVGDLLLKEVARRLKSCLRKEDFIARIGGDEFAIILDELKNLDEAGEVAQKIIEILMPSCQLENHDIHISSSIGIASYPRCGNKSETLIQNADIAMYYAKELGRNNYQYFTKELHKKHKNHVFLENELKFALEKNELFLTYQPIFDLVSKQVVGVEALICWKHPDLGLVSPSLFIPIAEENGQMVSIGNWVLKTACEQRGQWFLEGNKTAKLAVNVSAKQLLQANLVDIIKQYLKQANLPPSLLELEITETAVMTHTELFKPVIQEVSALGIGISVDDFGTGYSSLTHLKYLPISTLKIDQSFVHDLQTEPNDAIIIKSQIILGKNLSLNVIAEGIENKEQLNFLIENQCPQGQGYFLERPLTTTQVSALLKKASLINNQ